VLTAFEACIRGGGLAVFPADTVYGLACDPLNAGAVDALNALKGRDPAKAAAVMLFDRDRALAALPELGPRTRAALLRLLPGGVTVLLPNPEHRFPLACGADPDTLGLRVPAGSPLEGAAVAVLQSSANLHGGPDPRTVEEVPAVLREAAGAVLDAGPLPGVPSTVVDLRRYELDGSWDLGRVGAVPREAVAAAL